MQLTRLFHFVCFFIFYVNCIDLEDVCNPQIRRFWSCNFVDEATCVARNLHDEVEMLNWRSRLQNSVVDVDNLPNLKSMTFETSPYDNVKDCKHIINNANAVKIEEHMENEIVKTICVRAFFLFSFVISGSVVSQKKKKKISHLKELYPSCHRRRLIQLYHFFQNAFNKHA